MSIEPDITKMDDLLGMWILLVDRPNEDPDKLPMMAESGTKHKFMLSFKNAAAAKAFLATSEIDSGAEPLLLVKGNCADLLTVAKNAGASGVLIDFDPETQRYANAALLPTE